MALDDIAKALIEGHEGRRLKVYKDKLGFDTIGIGFNLNRADAKDVLAKVGADYDAVLAGRPLTDLQVDIIFDNLRADATREAAATCPNFDTLSDNRKAVLIDMAFQMGERGLSKFHGMLAAVEDGNAKLAAAEMLNSAWALQTPHRAKHDADLMIAG